MTYNEYIANRKNLVEEAQTMIDNGDLENAATKNDEIKALDAKWDATKEALDNLAALSDEQRAYNVQELTGAKVENGEAVARIDFNNQNMTEQQKMDSASDLYMTAFAKALKGDTMTSAEVECFQMVNDYTHTTGNTGVVVPTTFAQGIWDAVEADYPLWADVQKTYVKGNASIIKSTGSTDAAWYDEATPTADGTDSFGALELTGCELARSITVSYKLKEMAIADFIPFIQRKLAEKMGAGLGYALYSIFSRIILNRGYSVYTNVCYSFGVAMISFFILACADGSVIQVIESPSRTALGLLCGILTGSMAYVLYTTGMKGMETSRAAQLTTIEPVTAAILGSVLFHQPLSVWEIAGIAMVVGSVIMMNAGTKAVSN